MFRVILGKSSSRRNSVVGPCQTNKSDLVGKRTGLQSVKVDAYVMLESFDSN